MKTSPYRCIRRSGLSSVALLVILLAQSASAYTSKDCVRCHGQGSSRSRLHISTADFRSSIHGDRVACRECHIGVVDEKHMKNATSGAVDCLQCHEKKNRHGMGASDAQRPQCHSCHTRHGILPRDNAGSSVNPENLKTTCAGCHPVESGKTGYMAWLPSLRISSHKKQDFGHACNGDDCLGCHQGRAAHGEEGEINERRCYECHLSPEESRGSLMGYIHPVADAGKQPVVFIAAVVYQLAAVGLLIGGVKSIVRRSSSKNNEAERR